MTCRRGPPAPRSADDSGRTCSRYVLSTRTTRLQPRARFHLSSSLLHRRAAHKVIARKGVTVKKRYVFDPQVIHSVALDHLGPPSVDQFDHLIAPLAARYPGHIHGDQPWVFSNAGGAMIQIKLLHASLNEY